MQRTLFRSLSLFLVLVLLTNMLPMSIFAAELQQSAAEQQESTEQVQATEEVTQSMTPSEAYVVQEISEKRTEYSKEFLLSNGLRMAAVYPEAVHYEEDGQWADIDNTIKAHTDGTYRNTAGVWEVRFPNQLTRDNSISVTKDGYTLSFAMAGELTGTALSKSADSLSLGKVTPSAAQVQELSTRKEELTHPETVQDKLHSRLLYSKVYTDTHVQYDLTSNKVKESIIIESYNSSLRGYRYTLHVGEMIPVLEESGQILFYDKEQKNIVMVMPAPYLMDNDHQYSTDIQVQLTGKGSSYQLTYLLPQQWLAEEERAWPVILDPVITADMNVNNIRDMTVASGRIYPNIGVLDAGYYTDPTDNDVEDEITRFYLKYDNLPAITSSDVIIHAEIRLRKIDNSSSSAPIEVHKVTGTWDSSTITWGNKPAHNTTVEDVVTVQNAGHYTWEITDIAQGWYSGTNTGMMFKAPDSIENGGVNNFKQFYSSDYTDDDTYQPFLTVYFRNNNGLESYWDYTSSSAGRAGTGYVNHFTGNLIWIREDLGFGGNRMPVNIQHVYNLNDATYIADNNLSNDTAGNFFGLGNGWRTNYHQRVKYLASGWYLWEDADGTDHYFFKDTPGLYGTYKDEDGLELTFTNTGSDEETHCITDKDGNKSFFDFHGRLTKLQNNQATPSSITITYTTDTGPLIHTITDGAGRVYSFTYANNLLTKISYRGNNNTEHSYATFSYSGSNLYRIIDKDNRYGQFSYSGNTLITATDSGGYKLTYTYNTPAYNWQPYRVKSVTETDGSTAGGSLSIVYAHNQTTFTDHNGNVEIHQFNNFGNTVCIQDDEGRAQYTQFAFNTDDEKSANTDATKKANQLRLSSKLQNS
ncbi:MAG: DNRLRE domain-containing protein, partial [Lachnospiraceae bacterium]|nr:DNRLRE domain-containing protein [Lachnospiraceae bacterium]